jgi:acetyl-CoA carboxylase carboxyl transferase subunit alpha
MSVGTAEPKINIPGQQSKSVPELELWFASVKADWIPQAETTNDMEAGVKAEQELTKIEEQIKHLEAQAGDNQEAHRQLRALQEQVAGLRKQVTASMGAWQKTEMARHPQRPYTLDYIEHIFTDFSEIHGDRGFADDPALVCGMARFNGEDCLVIGTQKGRDTKQKVYRNFGMPSPEGYRKALRAIRMAEKWGRPVFCFVDTPGAYPGLGAEERGQAEAIARNLREFARTKVPIIVTITGEGGSGGALAIAIGDRVLMMENSIYSVISPEGCASIMWRDAMKRELAAVSLKITSDELIKMGIVDAVVPEPPGGAHTDREAACKLVGEALVKNLAEVKALSTEAMLDQRYEKFRKMAQFFKEE